MIFKLLNLGIDVGCRIQSGKQEMNFGLANWVLWDQNTRQTAACILSYAPIAEFFLVKGWETFLRNVALKIRGI